MASSASSRSRWRWPARRASSCSTSRPPACRRPSARELIEILTVAAEPHRLHHHRARHGRRAARRRERDDDAQRPHLQGRHAARRSSPTPRCRSSTSEAAMAERIAPAPRPPVLEITGLNVFYGRSHALQGVDLTLEQRRARRSSAATAWARPRCARPSWGWCRPLSGSIRFAGEELVGRAPADIARLGIGYVPQGRRLWRSLTVDEHLRARRRRAPRRLDHRAHLRRPSRGWPSASPTAARSSPAASSRCWRSRARCCSTRACW